jgi:hypothetical protein
MFLITTNSKNINIQFCLVLVLAWGSAQLHCFCSVSDTKVANIEAKGKEQC